MAMFSSWNGAIAHCSVLPSGYDVCRALKADEVTHDIPVIFISALDEPVDKVRAFQCGGADYVTKPFRIEEVAARIEHQMTIARLQAWDFDSRAIMTPKPIR